MKRFERVLVSHWRAMEIGGLDLNKVYANVGNHSKRTDDFIDRSKVKILLCDNDDKSLDEVLTLLSGCSYQGTITKLFLFNLSVLLLVLILSS